MTPPPHTQLSCTTKLCVGSGESVRMILRLTPTRIRPENINLFFSITILFRNLQTNCNVQGAWHFPNTSPTSRPLVGFPASNVKTLLPSRHAYPRALVFLWTFTMQYTVFEKKWLDHFRGSSLVYIGVRRFRIFAEEASPYLWVMTIWKYVIYQSDSQVNVHPLVRNDMLNPSLSYKWKNQAASK
jgi:hypothetical protein